MLGHVITANSPAAQVNPENWQDVLWHEFCHVVTLTITQNKMPRWLSEGISVYEESQANPAWGQKMNPHYREMVLGGELTPISDLSSAFMTPKSPYHVQFAYYESSLVVEYIVKSYGFDSLKQILTNLGEGVTINEAIARHTEPMPKLEKDFAAFVTDRARNLAPGLDWTKPDEDSTQAAVEMHSAGTNDAPEDIISRLMRRRAEAGEVTNLASQSSNSVEQSSAAVTTSHPAASNEPNYWQLLSQAQSALNDHRWADAKTPLQTLARLYPSQTGSDSAYALLAAVHRQLGETNEERSVLAQLAALDADDTDAYARLMELDAGNNDWAGVAENAERFLAVNPLLALPYRELARASEELGKAGPAIRSYQRLLLLDPPDRRRSITASRAGSIGRVMRLARSGRSCRHSRMRRALPTRSICCWKSRGQPKRVVRTYQPSESQTKNNSGRRGGGAGHRDMRRAELWRRRFRRVWRVRRGIWARAWTGISRRGQPGRAIDQLGRRRAGGE